MCIYSKYYENTWSYVQSFRDRHKHTHYLYHSLFVFARPDYNQCSIWLTSSVMVYLPKLRTCNITNIFVKLSLHRYYSTCPITFPKEHATGTTSFTRCYLVTLLPHMAHNNSHQTTINVFTHLQ